MSELPREIIAAITSILNSAEVPCVLWGHCLLNVHGIPSIVASIDFVVPDSHIQTSTKALSTLATQLTPCCTGKLCPSGSRDRCTPPPAFHMHTLQAPDMMVGLFRQSDTLWFLDPLTDLLLRHPGELKTASPFVAASDMTVLPSWRPGRGSGVMNFDEGEPPVMVPRAPILLEAFLRLYARDADKQIGSFALAMVDYMELYVDGDGLLDVTQLPNPLRDFYEELKEGDKPVSQWTKELQVALGVPVDVAAECSSREEALPYVSEGRDGDSHA